MEQQQNKLIGLERRNGISVQKLLWFMSVAKIFPTNLENENGFDHCIIVSVLQTFFLLTSYQITQLSTRKHVLVVVPIEWCPSVHNTLMMWCQGESRKT